LAKQLGGLTWIALTGTDRCSRNGAGGVWSCVEIQASGVPLASMNLYHLSPLNSLFIVVEQRGKAVCYGSIFGFRDSQHVPEMQPWTPALREWEVLDEIRLSRRWRRSGPLQTLADGSQRRTRPHSCFTHRPTAKITTLTRLRHCEGRGVAKRSMSFSEEHLHASSCCRRVHVEEPANDGWTETPHDEAVVGHIACRRAGGRVVSATFPLF